jgi:hypothetical protein
MHLYDYPRQAARWNHTTHISLSPVMTEISVLAVNVLYELQIIEVIRKNYVQSKRYNKLIQISL